MLSGLSYNNWLAIGVAIFTTLFVGGAYGIIRNGRRSTPIVPAQPEVPTGLLAERLRNTFEQFELTFLLDLAYIASGLGIGSNTELRERIQGDLFSADGWHIFASRFNQLVQTPAPLMSSPKPIEEVSPFSREYLLRNDELLAFLARNAMTLRRLYCDILWSRNDCFQRVTWREAESILNRLDFIYGEYDIAPEHV